MKAFAKVWLSIALIALIFGIGIIIIAITTGNFDDIPTFSINESYDNISSIDLDIEFGEINIMEGDTFSIKASNLPYDDFESYVSDGTWFIKDNAENKLRLFNGRFSLRGLVHWDDFTPDITITVPRNYTVEECKLSVGAGMLTVGAINAKRGELQVDAGELIVDELVISEKTRFNIGTGHMNIKHLDAKDVSIDCGVGSVEINGAIYGDNYINCNVGNVKLELDGEEEDYSYDIDAGIGSIRIDGDQYHSIGKRISNNNADNNIELECGIGNIEISFH
ncbi:DUF4097 family beta strand repeat protein [Lachnospiraceae bacterium MD1]|jgi:hypothetical protein|uniref:DUF4097 family beta strand repeat protein n=1 Tax=Variimorphobacter saccharofermentans TaxID=2755051 RepID=A0A839K0T7_9FIRM|nr:DUF4097 family beta strand repeat-containing protein [Variimorphobacter saccharofermentans]MBB2182341.1 DUF4097 family beta strand repeat protein [Variimorphobacter saccharofermentans]